MAGKGQNNDRKYKGKLKIALERLHYDLVLPLVRQFIALINCYSGILYSSAMRGFKITSTPMKANTENVIQFDLLTPLEN